MINYIRKFGISEYIIFIAGLLILGKQIFGYLTDSLELTFPHLIVFLIGLLMIFAPIFLVTIAKALTKYLVEKFNK